MDTIVENLNDSSINKADADIEEKDINSVAEVTVQSSEVTVQSSEVTVQSSEVTVQSSEENVETGLLSNVTTKDEIEDGQEYYVIPTDISKTPEEGPTQPRLTAYPKVMLGPSRSRSFCSNWFNRFPWLEYSIEKDKAYCFACRHYSSVLFKPNPTDPPGKKQPLRKGATIYATTGFCRWAKANERMQRHNSSARHLEAMGPWLEDTLDREKRGYTGTSLNGSEILPKTSEDILPEIEKSDNSADQGPLPSKRKRSRPTKKSTKYNIDDIEVQFGCPSWCSCTKCIDMTKMHECVCCCNVPEIRSKVEALDSTMLCITDHPGFTAICLNEWAIQVAYYQHKEENGAPSVTEEHERFRYIAYCQFVRWCWGFLREDMHIPLPSCVVNSIKATYHSQAVLPSLQDLPLSSAQ